MPPSLSGKALLPLPVFTRWGSDALLIKKSVMEDILISGPFPPVLSRYLFIWPDSQTLLVP